MNLEKLSDNTFSLSYFSSLFLFKFPTNQKIKSLNFTNFTIFDIESGLREIARLRIIKKIVKTMGQKSTTYMSIREPTSSLNNIICNFL